MRFAIATLGCKVNQYDSAIIEDRMRAAGYELAPFDEPADVYVVNTCTVTDRADSESLRLARRARRLNPKARVIATGCLAQATPDKLAQAAEIDAVVGLGRVDEIIRAARGEGSVRILVDNLRKHKAQIELAPVSLAGQTRAFLKVQEGCDQFCTFCIVPFSRGTSRSVEPRRILGALDDLHERGFKEVVLTGVHLGGYGRDLTPPVTVDDLLEMMGERSLIRRIRISSLDPEELSDRAISIVAHSEKFCPHFHLPLQAGEDGILARMRRRYDTAYYRGRVERILEAMPGAAIGTDLIVGFPGESGEEFDRGFMYIASLPLTYFHVFPYSIRAGTTAAKYSGKVAAGEVRRRSEQMRALASEKHERFAERFRGARLKVLLEERAKTGLLTGYSRNYIKVEAQGGDWLRNHEVEIHAMDRRGALLSGGIVSTRGNPGGQADAEVAPSAVAG
jgi:threonylcarbamoyladenosine tRNA methylthiotransferase MtaB